ncbi:prepilin peptidase CpaA [Amphibacillus marinus]|uniref:Prepilin peptidase CpaA n=1 Tax=Amphibacillus marinus TaxID=872970 RepID=A0A1H8R2R8_9BACI|nr:prepilin peptidase [Amphibacillus marinus]SEO60949.1 prepilin peptidase CpaA [Amphibacillus marinus]
MGFNVYLLAVFILIAFYFDARFQKIPNKLTGSGIVVGFIYFIIRNGIIDGMLFAGLGLIVSTVILLFLYFIKGVGAGDVKLFSAIGALMGMEFALYSLMYSILFAGFIAVVLLLYRAVFIKRMVAKALAFFVEKLTKKEQAKEAWMKKDIVQFPFMYAVLPGVIATILFYI